MKPVKPFNERKYKRHLYWWSDEGWVPYKYGLHASHTIENQKMSNDPNDDNYQPPSAHHLGPAAPAARPGTPVDRGLLDKSIRSVQREVAGAIWPVWKCREVENHPRKDELYRKYPDAFIHVPDLATTDGRNHYYPDGTQNTNGQITQMFFRSLQHRLIRMEGRIEMHLQQMFDVLVEELALIKMEKRSVTTWENTPWALDK